MQDQELQDKKEAYQMTMTILLNHGSVRHLMLQMRTILYRNLLIA